MEKKFLAECILISLLFWRNTNEMIFWLFLLLKKILFKKPLTSQILKFLEHNPWKK